MSAMAPSSNSNNTDTLIFQLGTRLDSLQKIPVSTGVLLAVSLASFFTYYDFSNYAYISPILKESWNLQDSEIALGASLTVLVYVIGHDLCRSIWKKTSSHNFGSDLGGRIHHVGVSSRYDSDDHIQNDYRYRNWLRDSDCGNVHW